MKKILMSVLLVMILGVCGVCVACDDGYTNAQINIENSFYEIELKPDGQEQQELSFKVNVENVDEISLYYYLKNDGVVKVDLHKISSTSYDVKVQPVKPGETTITLFLAEDSSIKKDVTVKVVQPISSLSLVSGYEYYAKLGERTVLNLGTNLVVEPANANVEMLKYSLINQTGAGGVSVLENGVLDATSCTKPGIAYVRISASEAVFVDLVVHIVEAVSQKDVIFSYIYANDKNNTIMFRNGVKFVDAIELIKTGSVSPETSYLEYYNRAKISFDASQNFNNYTVEYKITGTSAGSTFANGEWIKLAEDNFSVQGLGLGTSKLDLRVNIKGAESFFDYVEVGFDLVVIDAPTSIDIVDPSSTSSKNIIYESASGAYRCSVFNSYAQGTIGQPVKFNVRPTSVADDNSTLILEFTDAILEKVLFLDGNGYPLAVKSNKITIKASDVIYLKGIENDLQFSPEYSFRVYSQFSQKFLQDGGELVETRMIVNVYQGINYFALVGQGNIFLDVTGVDNKSQQIAINVGSANAKTNAIYYELSNSDGIVEIVKNNDLNYTINALKEGEVFVHFYSGNGFKISLSVKVYVPVKSIQIKTPNELENGYVGFRKFEGDVLQEIAVQVNGSFSFDVLTNVGGVGATIHEIKYVLWAEDGSSTSIIELQPNTKTIIVKGTGSVKIYVWVYGYNRNGIQTQQGGDAKYAEFTVTGYIPVQSIEMSSSYLTLKDPTTLSYNKVSNYSKASLSVKVTPSNATYDLADIMWSNSLESACLMSNIKGQYTELTALAINNVDQDTVTFTISASITIYGRVYTANCEVRVEKAVKVEKIYLDEIPYLQINFDSRKGLSTLEVNNDNNYFKISPRVAPSNAFDKSIQYDVMQSRNTNGENDTIFKITADGRVYPIKGGMGIIRVSSQDSFKNANEPNENICRYITVIVEDGKSKDTAFSVSNLSQLMAINDNNESLSNYYKLANNISLSGLENWQPIGSKLNPFTGWFSGANVIYEKEIVDGNYELKEKEKIQYLITGLNIKGEQSSISSGVDLYYGLFGVVNGVGLSDVNLKVNSINIDASLSQSALYFGSLVAYSECGVCSDFSQHSCDIVSCKIENCVVTSTNQIKILSTKGNNFIGGMIGFLKDTHIINSFATMLNLKEINVVATSSANLNLNIGGLVGAIEQTYFKFTYEQESKIVYANSLLSNLITGANLMKLNSASSTNEIIYATEFNNQGYDVYVDNINVAYSGSEKNIATSNIGGLVGRTTALYYTQSSFEIGSKVYYRMPSYDIDAKSVGDIVDFSVYAQINAQDFNNVGGIAGQNEFTLTNNYFDGKVKGAQNIGGIAGQSRGQILLARVYTYAQTTISGETNVGGIAGEFISCVAGQNVLIGYSYVSGANQNQGVFASNQNAGAIVGLISGGSIISSYADITCDKAFNVGNENTTVLYSYFIQSGVDFAKVDAFNYSYIATVTESGNEKTATAIYYENKTTTKNKEEFLALTVNNFADTQSLGAEYANINFSLPVIVYGSTYLFNVVYTQIEVLLNKDQTRSVILDEEKNRIMLFYYDLDSAYESTLNASKRTIANSLITRKNTYNLPELFSLKLSPMPFSSVVLNVSCLSMDSQISSTIAYINSNSQLVIIGEGVFRLVVQSKLNPDLKVEIEVYVTGYISKFGLYSQNSNLSIEYSLNRVAEWRKATIKEVFAIYESYVVDANDDKHILNKPNNFGLMFIQNFTSINTKIVESVDIENFSIISKNGNGDYYFKKSDQENDLMFQIGIEDVDFVDNLKIGQSKNVEYGFKLELEGVEFIGVSNGIESGNSISWKILYNSDNKAVEIKENSIVIGANTYLAFNDVDGGNGAKVRNSLYVLVKDFQNGEQTDGAGNPIYSSELEYYNAVLTQKIEYEDSPNVVSLYSSNVLEGEVAVKPYVTLNRGNLGKERVELNLSTVFAKSFAYKIFEGAESITSNLDKVVYSPSDAINMKLYLVSDTREDGIELVDEKLNQDLIVEIVNGAIKDLKNGKFEHSFDVTIRLKDTFEIRNIKDSRTYSVTFKSKTIDKVNLTKELTFIPQMMQRIDMLNYNSITATNSNETGNQVGFVLRSGESPSAYISPLNSGLIAIDIYPAYAEADIIQISSNIIDGIFVQFWQLYSYSTSGYVILDNPPQYADGGRVMLLDKITTKDYLGVSSFDGKMYVRTYVDSGVKPESIFTITVSALKLNKATGQYDEVLSNHLNLEVSGYPTASMNQQDGVYSYTQNGIENNLVIAGRVFNFSVALRNLDTVENKPEISLLDYSANSDLSRITILNPDVAYEEKDGAFVFNYSVFVGPDVSCEIGENEFRIQWSLNYLNQGKEEVENIEVNYTVIKYIVDKINLSNPFKTDTDLAYLNVYTITDTKVDSVTVKAMENNSLNVPVSINNNDERLFEMLSGYGGWYNSATNECKPIEYVSVKNENGENEMQFMLGDNILVINPDKFGEFMPNNSEDKSIEEIKNCEYKLGVKTIQILLRDELNNNYLTASSLSEKEFITVKYSDQNEFKTISGSSSEPLTLAYLGKGKGISLTSNSVGSNHNLKLAYDYSPIGVNNAPFYYERIYDLNIVPMTNLDLPQEIDSQTAFESMEEGVHYILMRDIVLTNYTPINANFASFDGNNHKITIENFNKDYLLSSSVSVGLFNKIATNSLVKNVLVDYSLIRELRLENATSVKVGLLAVENNGIITNCQVQAITKLSNNGNVHYSSINGEVVYSGYSHELNIITPSSISSIPEISMFVVNNYSSITHSRVMNTGSEYQTLFKIKASGVVAGFVVSNTGHISSSYSANIMLENNYSIVKDSKTAGFAVSNSGNIIQCFAKARYYVSANTQTVTEGGVKATNYSANEGYITSNGVIAGFTYENSGNIKDSYSNIPLISNASVAGFVYKNVGSATIENAYSASMITANSSVHMPFIGVDDLSNIQNDNEIGINNCYYLQAPMNYDYGINVETYPATLISNSKFNADTSYGGFSFGDAKPNTAEDKANTNKASEESVWYFTSNGPSLYSAEQIAVSERVVTIVQGVKSFKYLTNDASEGSLGTKTNPIIISNAQEYNYYIASESGYLVNKGLAKITGAYIRIVNDINFNDVNGEIVSTEIPLTLSNIEGNGFTLSNIVLKSTTTGTNSENIVDSIGLFAYVQNTNIRNLNLEIIQANCENVRILGGVAGVMIDSNISSVNVTSKNVMSARFVAGGIVGAIFGDSTLSQVQASASININFKPSVSITRPNSYVSGTITGEVKEVKNDKNVVVARKIVGIENIENLSYAGGIAGIIDASLLHSSENNSNSSSVETAYMARMALSGENFSNLKVKGEVTLSAQYVGGVVGYLGIYSHISNAIFELLYNDVDNLQYLDSEYCVGGLVAVNNGMISRSAVKHSDYYETVVEEEIETYLKTGQDVRKNKENLFKGDLWIAGGLVGLNNFGIIMHSYSTVDVEDKSQTSENITEQYLGGLIGWTYSGYLDTLYSTGNVYTAKTLGYIGGIAGRYTYVKNVQNFQLGTTFSNIFALNLWDENTIQTSFGKLKTHSGIIFGYVNSISSTAVSSEEKEELKSSATYLDDIRVYGDKNIAEGLLYVDKEDNSHNIIRVNHAIGTNLDKERWVSDFLSEPDNKFKYDQIFSDEVSAVVRTYFGVFEANASVWIYNVEKLPRLKISAISMQVEANDLITLLAVLQKAKYKTIIVNNDIDFDISKYSVEGSAIKYNGNQIPGLEFITGSNSIKTPEGILDFTSASLSLTGTKRLNVQYFTSGTFVGKLQSGKNDGIESANFNNINLSQFNDLGFFESLNKTMINNINFNFIAPTNGLTGLQASTTGLLAKSDYASAFMNVNVNLIGKLTHNSKIFGGFIGESNGSSVFTNCNFNGEVTYLGQDGSTNIASKYLGGFVGNGANLTFDSCNLTTNIVFDDYGSATSSAYVGGFVGRAGNLIIRSSGITQIQPKDNSKSLISSTLTSGDDGIVDYNAYFGGAVGFINSSGSGSIGNLNISGKMEFNNHVALIAGGIAGQTTNTTFSNISVGQLNHNSQKEFEINAKLKQGKNSANVNTANDKLYLGGLVGNAIVTRVNSQNLSNEANICVNLNVTLNGRQGSNNNATTRQKFSVGGAIGRFEANTSNQYISQNLYVKGKINFNQQGEYSGGGSCQRINLGGVLGENILTKPGEGAIGQISNIYFNNINSFVDINSKTEENIELFAGGFLGNTSGDSGEGQRRGQLTVENCFVAGSICADETKTQNGSVGGFAGSFRGQVGSEKSTTGGKGDVTIATSLILGENLGINQSKKEGQTFFVGAVFASGSSAEFGTKANIYVLEEIVGIYLNDKISSYYQIIKYADWLTNIEKKDDDGNAHIDTIKKLNISNAGNLLNPNSTFNSISLNANRYNLNSGSEITTLIRLTENNIRVIAFNNKEIKNSTYSLFSTESGALGIPSRTIVSNIYFNFTENKTGFNLISEKNSGTILGVYAKSVQGNNSYELDYSGTSKPALLLGSHNGAIYDVMLDCEIKIAQNATFSYVAYDLNNAVVNNVQILGSANIDDGKDNGNGAYIRFIGASSENKNQIKNITVATNIVSNADYNAMINSNQSSDRLENIAVDTFSMKFNSSGIAKFTELSRSIYNKDSYSNYVLYDIFNSSDRKSKITQSNNYSYAYLSRFEGNINTSTTKYANNYSMLKYLIDGNKDATLINNFNRAIFENENNVVFTSNYSATFEGQNFGIYGIMLYETTKTGIFSRNLSSATIQNITFDYHSLISGLNSNQKYAGLLASEANGVTLNNVTITYSGNSNNNTMLGIAVGGVLGKGESVTLNNVQTSNFVVRALNNGEQGVSSPGIAGGFMAYANNSTIENSKNSSVVVGGNALEGSNGKDAGAVGGFVGISNGGQFNSNTLKANVYTGDASNGSNGANQGYNTEKVGGTGSNGGNIYIGGIVGKMAIKVNGTNKNISITSQNSTASSFSNNTVSLDNLLTKKGTNYDRLSTHRYTITIVIPITLEVDYAAGKGGNGGKGADGENHGQNWDCQKVGPRESCGENDDGYNGGKGGNGGYSYIGKLYGYSSKVGYKNDLNLGEASKIYCAPGGDGGEGGKGGAGHYIDLLIGKWWHQAQEGGNGGDCGKNGNNQKVYTSKPTNGSGHQDSSEPTAGGKGGVSKSELAYLQS